MAWLSLDPRDNAPVSFWTYLSAALQLNSGARATDLRFTSEEAAAYLNEVMGLDLTAQDVARLEARTEGWSAALQLAALSRLGGGPGAAEAGYQQDRFALSAFRDSRVAVSGGGLLMLRGAHA